MTKAPSEQFYTCRKLVHDDAFEAKCAAQMALPLLRRDLSPLAGFLRRALTSYLAIALSRLLEKPKEGHTGVTASVSSLLDMAKSENLLRQDEIEFFVSDFKRIKAEATQGEYDLVQALRDLRNIHLAHSLIPKKLTNDVFAHHLTEFAEAIFDLVMKLDKVLEETTGTTLAGAHKDVDEFKKSSAKFWQALTSIE
jgi:hypothetical protein